MIEVRVIHPDGKCEKKRFKKRAVIGRREECDVFLPSHKVSYIHAEVEKTAEGLRILDAGSTNGTFVNGERVTDTFLKEGDIVNIGDYSLVFTEVEDNHETFLKEKLSARLRVFSSWEEAVHYVEEVMRGEGIEVESGRIRELVKEMFGFGKIMDLMEDETISEVMINGTKNMYVEKSGKIYEIPHRFESEDEINVFVERLLLPAGKRVDESVPYADARLPDGSRLHVIIPPISMAGPVVTIRKFSRKRITADELVRDGSISEEAIDYLKKCVENRKSIVVSGGTGSGKTTFLNILSSFIPAGERIITIEDTAELSLIQSHVVSLEARPPNIEGKGEVTIRDLVRNALRMRPDRIIVGECRGTEAFDMLQAMNTGHEGSMTTLHANSPRDALFRLEAMVMMTGMDLPLKAIRLWISSAVDVIVHIARLFSGKRVVMEIDEVKGLEEDVILLERIFYRKGDEFISTGYREVI